MRDVAAIVAQRRAMQERLQPVADAHGQRAEALQEAVRNGRRDVQERLAENKITRGHNFDLFVTPDHLAERMVLMLYKLLPCKVLPQYILEPSAGTGRIAKAISKVGAIPVCVEFAYSTYAHLLEQGYTHTRQQDFLEVKLSDFLEDNGGIGEYGFRAVLMNPPFSSMADILHVLHAYEMLAVGGILIAVMSEGSFNGDRKLVSQFRRWSEFTGGTSEKLDAGTFKESGTNVSARLFTVRKT